MNIYVVNRNGETEKIKPSFKEKVKEKANEAKAFVVRNKDVICTAIPIAIGATTTIIKVVGKHHNLKKQETLQDCYCYDRSLGHYWRLRRPLSNNEWLEIDKRKKNGERLSDILSDLKVLK